MHAPPMRTFRSDNGAGLCPEALAAILEANDGGHAGGYGDDAWTRAADAAFRALFEADAVTFLVATGSAANTLAVAALTEPWQSVICHETSHWNEDESTAPERITHCRTVPLAGARGKMTIAALEDVLSRRRGDVHQPQPGVVTISNPTETGLVYRPAEVAALADAAHRHGYALHVDGARFANAVAFLGCHPADLTVRAGVDALSFGGTKNGLASGEAIVLFPQQDRRRFDRAVATLPFHRKGTGHLLSKHRFIAAPFARVLSDGTWLRHASRANAQAGRLGAGLSGLGMPPAYEVEANAVFVRLPAAVDAAWRALGHRYYPFGDSRDGLVRLMTSFDTQPQDVDALLDAARG